MRPSSASCAARQRRDAVTPEEMDALLTAVERQLGASWRQVVDSLRDQNSLDDIAARLRVGDIDGAVRGVQDAAASFATDLHAAYVDAGKATSAYVDSEVDAVVRFDQVNQRAVNWATRNKMDLVREVTQEQRDLVRQVIVDGTRGGDNPLIVARTLRQSLGLTAQQAQIVENYRKALEAGDWSNALGRELSDGRSDRSVTAAQSSGKAMTQAQIDTAVDRYRTKMVNLRADTIARTEGLRAVHQGAEEALQQAVDNGDVDKDDIVRSWHHANVGKNSRPGHKAMNGQKRKLGEAFETGDGVAIKYPGDPDAGPEQVLNCRCCLTTRLT